MIAKLESLIVRFHRLRFFAIYGRAAYKKSHIYGVFSIVCPDKFEFSDDLSLNEFTYINATGGVKFGKNVILSAGAKIISTGLSYTPPSYTYVSKPVVIGDNVQIGAGAIVLAGVNIVDDVIVGAGCVVSKDITKPGVYVGIPAKQIR